MADFEQEKQARRELAQILRQNKLNAQCQLPKQIGDVPTLTTLREMGRHHRASVDYGKRLAVDALMDLIVKHRFLAHLPAGELRKLLEEEAGIKEPTIRTNG